MNAFLAGAAACVFAALAVAESPERVPAYAAVSSSVALAPGCTPMLDRWQDGSLSFRGCPTNACGEANPCQAETIAWPGGEEITCECMDPVSFKVLCEGWVELDESGLVVGTACYQADCFWSCTMALPGQPGPFYLCDC